jgi:hypothetical protein
MSSPKGRPDTPEAVTRAWDEIKRQERAAKPQKPQGLLDDVRAPCPR